MGGGGGQVLLFSFMYPTNLAVKLPYKTKTDKKFGESGKTASNWRVTGLTNGTLGRTVSVSSPCTEINNS